MAKLPALMETQQNLTRWEQVWGLSPDMQMEMGVGYMPPLRGEPEPDHIYPYILFLIFCLYIS